MDPILSFKGEKIPAFFSQRVFVNVWLGNGPEIPLK